MLQLLDDLSLAKSFRSWDPFAGGIGNFFTPSWGSFVTEDHLPVNVYANEDAAKVLVNIPGWEATWFGLSVDGNKLHLTGETPVQEGETHSQAQAKLSRVVKLPFRIDADQVDATYRNGILTVDLVRSAEDKPQKIKIKAA